MKFDKETIFYNYQMKGENCVLLLEFIYIPPNRSCWRITHWYISFINIRVIVIFYIGESVIKFSAIMNTFVSCFVIIISAAAEVKVKSFLVR